MSSPPVGFLPVPTPRRTGSMANRAPHTTCAPARAPPLSESDTRPAATPRMSYGCTMDPARELEWLRRLRDLSHQMATEKDPQALLRRILDAAVELTGAERGFLVRTTGVGSSGRP